MEVPLSPLVFADRARKLYSGREAVVDDGLRLTYAQFFERCDRWSAALQALGVRPGDRVAYIAPNTHAQLESFYSVPQIGAALVPINFRLTADDFAYLIHHSGAGVVCAHSDFLDAVDRIRSTTADADDLDLGEPACRRLARRFDDLRHHRNGSRQVGHAVGIEATPLATVSHERTLPGESEQPVDGR